LKKNKKNKIDFTLQRQSPCYQMMYMYKKGLFYGIFFALLTISSNLSSADLYAYPIPLSDYPEAGGLWKTLCVRASEIPFNLYATAIFFLAIVHTFYYRKFLEISERLKLNQRMEIGKNEHNGAFTDEGQKRPVAFLAEVFHLMGEVEAIFALWLIPLFAGFWFVYGWGDFTAYLDKLTFVDEKFVEPVFVVVVMCIAATRPIIQLSGDIINLFAKMGGGRIAAWWISILTVGPLLGSFITEPAAITICATLLAEKFFAYEPSNKFKYATVGILLVAISAGGTLTHFSAPPVLMVAGQWGWDMPFMFFNFGWKAIAGISLSVFFYFLIFRREFSTLQVKFNRHSSIGRAHPRVPWKIVAVHVGFLIFTVHSLHHPALFLFAFLLFLSFVEATRQYQFEMRLKTPLLVGLFLAALVTHGSLQGWWIEPVLTSLGQGELFFGTVVLTAFNDNAAITYLASLVPDFSHAMKYMVVAGAVAGGGLTIIANAPNPAGMSILKKFFSGGVSPKYLFYGAFAPTAIVSLMFYLF